MPGPHALAPQQGMDPRTAIGAMARVEQTANLALQSAILARVPARLAPPPSVIAAPSDPQLFAEPPDREPVPLLIDEREDIALRSEQNRIAFFRSSCSSLSIVKRALSTLKRLSSAGEGPGGRDLVRSAAAREPAFAEALARGARSSPSRDCLRQRDSMNGWIVSASATSPTFTPGTRLSRTAVRLNSTV